MKTDKNNFYIFTPMASDGKLIYVRLDPVHKGKFGLCQVKCGKAIDQNIETRRQQEGKNVGEMMKLYEFYIPNETSDNKVYGFQKLYTVYDSTIWANLPDSSLVDCVKENKQQGREYMDITKLANYAAKEFRKRNPDLFDKFVKGVLDADNGHSVIEYLRLILDPVLEKLAELYGQPKEKKDFKMTDYQQELVKHFDGLDLYNKTAGHIVLELPPRWGKTPLTIYMFENKFVTKKMVIVTGYVKTVLSSYLDCYASFDTETKILNLDKPDEADISSFVKGDRVIVILPATGLKNTKNETFDESCFVNRWNVVKQLMDKIGCSEDEVMVVNEEADYGTVTRIAEKNFGHVFNKTFGKTSPLVVSLTGTEAKKAKMHETFGPVLKEIIVNDNDFFQFFG